MFASACWKVTFVFLLYLKPWRNLCLLLSLCLIGEMSGKMSPIANMLLVILLDLGVDVLMSEKKTSSVVEDVRLILTENRLTLLRGSERAARSAE